MTKEERDNLTERVRAFLPEHAETLKRHGLATGTTIRFPGNKVPLAGRLAIWLINRCGGKIDLTFVDRPND